MVLLGWGKVWISRDSTFHYWTPPAKKLGFHARWVLDGDDLALAEVVGRTEAERFDAYMRFVPLLRYLRWDRRAPAFLAAWVPRSRRLANPFYYQDDLLAEIPETYRRLLARLGREAPGAVLVDIDGLLATLVPQCTPPCMQVMRLPLQLGFPYRMPNEHFSPLGNRLVATTLLHAMYPDPDRVNDAIRVGPEPVAGAPTGPPIALRDAVRIDVALGGRVVAGLYARPKSPLVDVPSRVDRLPADVPRLLAVVGGGQTLLDAPLLPLSSADGSPEVALEVQGTTHALDVAPAAVGTRELGILRLDPCDVPAFRRALGLALGGTCRVVGQKRELPQGTRARVLVDGKPAIAVSVTASDAVTMALADDAHYVVLPDGDGSAEDPGPGGFVELRLGDAAGAERRVRLAAWRRVPFSGR